jgi:SPP1 gp7 family putative phage head morphogenesis protein
MSQSTPAPFAWKKAWAFTDSPKGPAYEAFKASRRAEREYERRLMSVAVQVAGIIKTGGNPEAMEKQLRAYAGILEPWARQSAETMLRGAMLKNRQAWMSYAGRMGADMKRLVDGPGVGEAVRQAIAQNVTLIQSIALGSADRVAEITRESLYSGSRAEDIAKRIEAVGEVGASRARLIARTEVSKAGTALTRARATDVGSTGYIWRTARDGATRPSHRAMEGVFVSWDKPVVLDRMIGHAGEFPNCRCYPEPVIPNDAGGVFRPSLPTAAQERNHGEQRLFSTWERTEGSHVLAHTPGAPLPNVDRAVYNDTKAVTYSLNLESPDPRARAHARAFLETLGMTQADAPSLKAQVMAQLPHLPAERGKSDTYGERFQAYVPVTGPNGRTIDVLAAWIYEKGKYKTKMYTTPHLATLYIDKKGMKDYAARYPRI